MKLSWSQVLDSMTFDGTFGMIRKMPRAEVKKWGRLNRIKSKLDFKVRKLKRETRLLAFLMKPALARLSDVLDRLT